MFKIDDEDKQRQKLEEKYDKIASKIPQNYENYKMKGWLNDGVLNDYEMIRKIESENLLSKLEKMYERSNSMRLKNNNKRF